MELNISSLTEGHYNTTRPNRQLVPDLKKRFSFFFFKPMHENLYKTFFFSRGWAIKMRIYLRSAMIPEGKTNTYNWTEAKWMTWSLPCLTFSFLWRHDYKQSITNQYSRLQNVIHCHKVLVNLHNGCCSFLDTRVFRRLKPFWIDSPSEYI